MFEAMIVEQDGMLAVVWRIIIFFFFLVIAKAENKYFNTTNNAWKDKQRVNFKDSSF